MFHYFRLKTEFVPIRVAVFDRLVVKISLGSSGKSATDNKTAESSEFFDWCVRHFEAMPILGPVDPLVAEQLQNYLAGRSRTIDFPHKLIATPFVAEVLEQMRKIPYGELETYGGLAARLGKPKAARAVGAACGANPLPLLYPCHRVIGKNGKLVGFGSGIANKQWLLRLEGSLPE